MRFIKLTSTSYTLQIRDVIGFGVRHDYFFFFFLFTFNLLVSVNHTCMEVCGQVFFFLTNWLVHVLIYTIEKYNFILHLEQKLFDVMPNTSMCFVLVYENEKWLLKCQLFNLVEKKSGCNISIYFVLYF